MPRFAANLSLLFTELDFPLRFEAAAGAGFRAVECQFPYAWPVDELARARQRSGLEWVLHNLPAGDWSAGDRGIAALPERVEEFRHGVDLALEYAGALGCRQLNCLAGIAPAAVPARELRRTFVENLRFAADRLRQADMRLLIEPINTYDVPGVFLHGTRQALAIIDEVGRDNLFLQYDIYHMQRMEGDPAAALRRHRRQIGHVQLADHPGRHEPGTGEIDFAPLFAQLDADGYAGWVGCEYTPRSGTLESLRWLGRGDETVGQGA